MRFLLLAIALTLALTSANAEYDAVGLGTVSCGRWSAARRDRDAFALEQWVLGFLSGVGYVGAPAGTNPLNEIHGETVLAWMDKFCFDHPLDLVMNATARFITAHPH